VTAAEAAVPLPLRARTPLFIWATAGMRLLPQDDQAALYDTLFGLVRHRTAFAVARADGFRTISGTDEGFYAWLAANALAGADLTRVMPGGALPPTLGALDLGGGSAQVVSAAGADARCELGELRARAQKLPGLPGENAGIAG
jgi:Golgi nucleoside diphosphatase